MISRGGRPLQGLHRRASRAYGEATVSSEPKIQELTALYAMLSRMRVLSFATNRRLRTEGHGGNDHNLFLPEQDGAGTT